MTQIDTQAPSFSLSDARSIVRDLFKPNPLVYWSDFILTFGLGVFCFQSVRGGSLLTPHQGITGEWSQLGFFICSIFLFYRAAMFIHEIIHLRNESLRGFSFVWNLLCGIPFLMPSFVYYTHMDHHRRSHYGTEHDGEYLPLTHRSPWYVLFYLSWSFVIPVLAILRFAVLTPVSWMSPRFRKWLHKHASSMVMDPMYIRPLPSKRAMRIIRIQEVACFVWCLGVAVVPPVFMGRWPVPFLIHAYLTGSAIILINSIRTLGSHRWTNKEGEMTFLQQLVDSANFPNWPIVSELWGPIGTRYHALHHLFPSMPYHSLPAANRRLLKKLPSDSPYRETIEPSLASALLRLFRATCSRAK